MKKTIKKQSKQAKIKLSKVCLTIVLAGLSTTSTLSFAVKDADNSTSAANQLTYPIVDSNQTACFGLTDTLSTCPAKGDDGFGQDSQYQGFAASYSNNGNGTVTDNNTQLMWVQTIDTNGDGEITVKDKMTYDDAMDYAKNLKLAGYADWRIPDIKELYSLMMFDGEDPSGLSAKGNYALVPFIDNSYFGYNSGDTDAGERLIDSQYLSRTKYVSTTMRADETVFGVNFIDGRIKGYGVTMPRGAEKTFYVLAVRGNTDYGVNQLVDNNNSTITDTATKLTWQKGDSERGMDWNSALQYCENLTLAGSRDWRLPNAKELQSIVDYTRSPDTTDSASIDSLFDTTSIINEAEKIDYANYWSSSTHLNLHGGQNAAYLAFGRSLGNMNGNWIDVHGAGAQRSDPKTGDASQFSEGHGPQGDAIRINNYVRCVTDDKTEFVQQPATVEREAVIFTLTGNEAAIAGQRGTVNRQGVATQKGNNRQQGMNSQQGRDPFTMLDTNGDGKLSKQEARGPLANDFDRIDVNADGYISQSELPKKHPRN